MSGIHQMLFGGGSDTELMAAVNWTTDGGYTQFYGFSDIFGGSLIDGKFALAGGATIKELSSGGLGTFYITFMIDGNWSNSGWESLTIKRAGAAEVVLVATWAT